MKRLLLILVILGIGSIDLLDASGRKRDLKTGRFQKRERGSEPANAAPAAPQGPQDASTQVATTSKKILGDRPDSVQAAVDGAFKRCPGDGTTTVQKRMDY